MAQIGGKYAIVLHKAVELIAIEKQFRLEEQAMARWRRCLSVCHRPPQLRPGPVRQQPGRQ